MSRIKRFTHSLLSGYVLLGLNVLFTLGSVRLALHFLGKPEFGLWAITTQIAGYIALIDLGITSASARILIDYKDHKEPGAYGGMIQTGAWVGISQACLVCCAGCILAFVAGPLLNIEARFEREFFWLLIAQAGVTGTLFATRIISNILIAHQRFDVANYSGAFSLVVNGGVMWLAFAKGAGVYSLMWGQAAGVILTAAINGIWCCKLGLLPARGQWGRPSWKGFLELFAFGRDIFVYTLGAQLVNASQAVLLTRLMGLDAAAVWSVTTRAFVLLLQFVGRIFDFSSSALAEMMVQGQRDRLMQRFRDVAVLSTNLAVAAGAVLAVTNNSFVQVWTKGEFGWPPVNDMLLAVWLVLCVTAKAHTGLVGQTKVFRFLRYVYFVEGISFITLTVLFYRFGGITLMLAVSVLCSLCWSCAYGLWRTRGYFHLTWADMAHWHRSTLALAATVAPVAFLVWWLARNLPPLQRLIANAAIVGAWTALMFVRYGLGASLRIEVCRRAPVWMQPILYRTGFAK